MHISARTVRIFGNLQRLDTHVSPQQTPVQTSCVVRGKHNIVQYESRDCEANETDDGEETENTIDEDGCSTISIHVATKFGDKSPRIVGSWFEFLFIFYLEQLFDDFTRKNEANKEKDGGRGGEKCWDCEGVRPKNG